VEGVKKMSDHEKHSTDLVGAGLRAGTLFYFGPAGTPGPTSFWRTSCDEVNKLGNCFIKLIPEP
jgi:hypothetical protein